MQNSINRFKRIDLLLDVRVRDGLVKNRHTRKSYSSVRFTSNNDLNRTYKRVINANRIAKARAM